MPGIESDRSPAVDARLLSTVGNEPVAVPPGINDFLGAFRSGFLTVDDITRRTLDKPVEQSNRETTLAADDFKRKRIADANVLAPRELELAQQKQTITGQQQDLLGGQLTAAQTDEALRLSDHDAWVAKHLDERTASQYSDLTGSAPPKELRVPNPHQLSYDDWFRQVIPEVTKARAEFFGTPGTSSAIERTPEEQQLFLNSEKADLARRYQEYQKNSEEIMVPRGTEEYAKALQKKVAEYQKKAGIDAAKMKALPGILEKTAVPPVTKFLEKTVKRIENGTENEYLLQVDPQTGEVVKETRVSSNPINLTDAQANGQMFASRMGLNDTTLSRIEVGGFDPTAISSTVQDWLPNRFTSDEFQQYSTAKNNWIAAVLRKESGAAISKKEYADAGNQYFPRDGDSKLAVTQKQALRKLAEDEMRRTAGPNSTTPAAAKNPPPTGYGLTEVQNGITYQWDGTKYVPK